MKNQDKLSLTIISREGGALRVRQIHNEAEIWPALAEQILAPLGSETPECYRLQIKHFPDGSCRVKILLTDAPVLELTLSDELALNVDDLEGL